MDRKTTKLYELLEKKSWKTAQDRALKYPEECSTWITETSENGETIRLLPLHGAILLGAPEETVGQILMCYREGAKCKNHMNQLPLHLALLSGSSIGVISLLMLSYPASVDEKDPNGLLPMDLARMSPAEHKDEYLTALSWSLKGSSANDVMRSSSETYENPTTLFRLLIEKKWDDAVARIETNPEECMSWVHTKEKGVEEKLIPLHVAVTYGAPERLVRILVSAYPDSVRLVDGRGLSPLHRAITAQADIGVVVELLIRYPEGVTTRDNGGRTASDKVSVATGSYRQVYQWAIEWASDFKVHYNDQVEFFNQLDKVRDRLTSPPPFGVDELPEVSLVMTGNQVSSNTLFKDLTSGDGILYKLIKKRAWPQVCQYINECPDECSQWIMKLYEDGEMQWRLLPLHACVIYGAPENVIRELLLIYRAGAKCQDDAGLLPLHLAIKVGSSVGVVTLLVLAYRDSIFVRNKKGKLPLDMAQSCTTPEKNGYMFVLSWAWECSSSVFVSDDDCQITRVTKLYELIKRRQWNDAYSQMMRFPSECKQPVSYYDDYGIAHTNQLPIHAAVIENASEAFVRILLKIYPEGANFTNGDGMLPLHSVLEKDCKVGVVALLIMAHPEAVYSKDDRGRSPLDIANVSPSPYKTAFTWLLRNSSRIYENDFRKDAQDSLPNIISDKSIKGIEIVRTYIKSKSFSSSELWSHMNQQQWITAREHALKYPEECSTWITETSENGETIRLLPLHGAILLGAPEETVGQILMCYREGAKCKNHMNQLPLHLALLSGSSIGVISLLMLSYPASVNEKDPNGLLPMDLARMSPAEHKDEYLTALSWSLKGSSANDVMRSSSETYENPTTLFRLLIEKKWDDAVARIETNPEECMSWVHTKEKGVEEKLIPLHVAVTYGAPEHLVRILVSAYPDSVRLVDGRGLSPLHRAITAQADIGVVVELLIRYPEGVTTRDNGGRTASDKVSVATGSYRQVYQWAIEWASEYDSDKKEQILNKYDEVKFVISHVPMFDNNHELPEVSLVMTGNQVSSNTLFQDLTSGDGILYKLIKKRAWPQVCQYINECPDECSQWIMKLYEDGEMQWRLLPLHACVIYGAPENVIRELLLIYRDGAKCQDDAGLLPLHLAIKVGSSVGVVTLLVLAYRDSIFVRNKKGKLPLDLAQSCTTPEKNGYMFVFTWALCESPQLSTQVSEPRAIIVYESVPFSTLEFPSKLFMLICTRRWLEVSNRLKEFPDECAKPTTCRNEHEKAMIKLLPIHAAILHGAPEDVIRDILTAYPKGASSVDGKNKLPIHLALLSNCTVGVVILLLAAFPSAVAVRDNRGRLPMDIVESSKGPYKNVYAWALQTLPAQDENSAGANRKCTVNSSYVSHGTNYGNDEVVERFRSLSPTFMESVHHYASEFKSDTSVVDISFDLALTDDDDSQFD